MPRPLHGPACKEAQLTAQAHFYIYGATRVSKRTFDDEFFRDVLRVQNPQCGFLARSKIKYHVAAEYLLFEVAFGWMLENLHKDFQGNPFAQGMHDGVTLANKKCYQSMCTKGSTAVCRIPLPSVSGTCAATSLNLSGRNLPPH